MKNHIAIIGGGIGGAATAVALQHFGIRATIYERAPELREAGAGMMLWPNATRVLRELGVLEDMIPLGGRSTSFLVRAQDGRVLMNLPLGNFDVPALCVRRTDLLQTLRCKLPADSIRLAHEFSHLEQPRRGRPFAFRECRVCRAQRCCRRGWNSISRACGDSRRDRAHRSRLHGLARHRSLRRRGDRARQ